MNPPPDSSRPEPAGRGIPIVDDDRLNGHILLSILKPEGYRSLRYDGMRKVLRSLATIEEIEQNTPLAWAP